MANLCYCPPLPGLGSTYSEDRKILPVPLRQSTQRESYLATDCLGNLGTVKIQPQRHFADVWQSEIVVVITVKTPVKGEVCGKHGAWLLLLTPSYNRCKIVEFKE